MLKSWIRMSDITGVNLNKYNTGFVAMKFWNVWDSNQEQMREVFASQLKQIKPRTLKVNNLLTGETSYL